MVEGYEGEPYVRIQPDGTVEINQDSPSFYLNQDRFGEAPVPEAPTRRRPRTGAWPTRAANTAGTTTASTT